MKSRLNLGQKFFTVVVGMIALVNFSGCSTTHVVNKVEGLAFDNLVTVVFVNGNKLNTQDVYVLGDQFVAIDRRTKVKHYINISEIKMLIVKNRKRGACLGLLVGGVGASTSTAVLGGTSGMASVAVGFFGGAGALVGAISGGIKGTNTCYLIELDSTQMYPDDLLSHNEGDKTLEKIEQDKAINYYGNQLSMDAIEINTWIRQTFDKHPGQLTQVEQKQAIEILQLAYSQKAKLRTVSDYYFKQIDTNQDGKK